MTLPPVPRGPHLLHTAGWITRPGPYSRRLRAKFGDTFTLHVDRRAPWVVLSHPDDVKQVFTGDPNVLHAGEGNAILRPLLGARSVLLLDGPEHMRERKTLLPPFHGERMQAYGDLIREIAEAEVASWPLGNPISRPPAHAGADARDHHARRLRHAATSGCARSSRAARLIGDPLRLMFAVLAGPQLTQRAFGAHARAARRAARGEIAGRRAAPDLDEREDILSMLLAHPTWTTRRCATSC